MSKLLKIRIVRELQENVIKPVDDIEDFVIAYNSNLQYVDFDQIFNFCGFNKARFVGTYSTHKADDSIWKIQVKPPSGKYVDFVPAIGKDLND